MRWMLRVMILIFMLRVVLALLPSFQVDMVAWLAWAHRMAELGPSNFYSEIVWTQYTPGFLYWLWGVGEIGWVDPLAIKIPTILADIMTGYLIYRVMQKSNKLVRVAAIGVYALNPIAIFNGSVWGQVDGILTLAMFGAAYLLIEKEQLIASFAMLAIAFLIKLQAMAIFPVMGILALIKYGWKKTAIASMVAMAITVLGYAPFFPQNLLQNMLDLVQKMGVSYPYTSLFAFNAWSYVGMWINDSELLLGQTYFVWGSVMSLLAIAAILFRYRKQLGERATQYLLLSLSCYIFFLFPTRVHERYLFPMFAFLFAYAGLMKKKYIYITVCVSLIAYLFNLYLPYSHYESALNPLKNVGLEVVITQMIPVLSSIQLLGFFVLLLSPGREKSEKSIPVRSGESIAVKHG